VKFLSERDIASNLDATLECGGKQISSPFDNVDEVFLVAAYYTVCLAPFLVRRDRPVLDGHKPAAHLIDVEKIGPANTL
jgi:hypothetical protein